MGPKISTGSARVLKVAGPRLEVGSWRLEAAPRPVVQDKAKLRYTCALSHEGIDAMV